MCDGVLEIAPFQSQTQVEIGVNSTGLAKGLEENPQGMIKVHRLPILHERGGGGGESGRLDDLAFTLSRRKGLVIKPFSLPPVDGDVDLQKGGLELDHGKGKIDIEF
jgi:elongator complex protein 4